MSKLLLRQSIFLCIILFARAALFLVVEANERKTCWLRVCPLRLGRVFFKGKKQFMAFGKSVLSFLAKRSEREVQKRKGPRGLSCNRLMWGRQHFLYKHIFCWSVLR